MNQDDVVKRCEQAESVRDALIMSKNAAMNILGFRHGAIDDCALAVHKALGLPPGVNIIDGAKLIIESRDNTRRECDEVTRGFNSTLAELDELRTRHARLVDSTDTLVAALVDERFKKDHAAMLAELHTFRTKDIEASQRLRIEINAMPESARAIFESARVEAKSKGVTILRTLVGMVANARLAGFLRESERDLARGECDRLRAERHESYDKQVHTLDAEVDRLKDECRKHLARINVLESELHSFKDRRQPPKDKIRPAIACGPELLRYAVEYANSNLHPGDWTPTPEQITNAEVALKPKLPNTPWLAMVRWYVENNMRELDGARFESEPIPMILHCPQCNARHIDAGEYATKSHHTHACQSCGTVWRPAIGATVGVQFLPGFKDATTLPANESTGQDAAKVEGKAKDATSANVVPDDVLQRAADWANRSANVAPEKDDVQYARNVINNESSAPNSWKSAVREFVKLWREGQAPDVTHKQDVPLWCYKCDSRHREGNCRRG
jgi:hypothetical protein